MPRTAKPTSVQATGITRSGADYFGSGGTAADTLPDVSAVSERNPIAKTQKIARTYTRRNTGRKR